MKSLKVTNLGEIRNELNKYKKGKKFDIWQFNQVARLAWLGKLTLQPLDSEDAECKAYLAYVAYPDELAAHFLEPDEDLMGHMHIVDGDQAAALAKVIEQGVRERAALYQELRQRDFYFGHFFAQDTPDGSPPGEE
ncbi:MAG: hypothetical protein B7Z66_01040 [Chromatiales bacterium 21-64-14]|nr:MAG: hypothetical protein B7Z66_01040 [Chromatiales bacterium 21-64-14]HQU16043.1 hypothetical protein [Gammaproteobacteria bacterium]